MGLPQAQHKPTPHSWTVSVHDPQTANSHILKYLQMKNLKCLSVLIILISLITSCKRQLNEDDLIGTWKVVEFNADIPDLSPVLIQETNKIALSSVYTFNLDKSMLRKSDIELDGEVGKFELLNEGEQILMTYDTEGYNSKEKYNIVSFNGKSMQWEFKEGVLGNLVMKLKKQ